MFASVNIRGVLRGKRTLNNCECGSFARSSSPELYGSTNALRPCGWERPPPWGRHCGHPSASHSHLGTEDVVQEQPLTDDSVFVADEGANCEVDSRLTEGNEGADSSPPAPKRSHIELSLQEDALSQRNVVPWFPLEEKELLATLVNRYKHILECMKTNGVSLPKKIETWKKVAELYNLSHAVIRCSPGQLKKCWDNMKLSCQEEAAELQRDYYRIGVRASRTMSPLSEQVKAIASHIFTRLFNPYDSDRPGQEHVKNLPVVRIFQPMVDGSCDVESDYTDDQSEPNSPVPEQSEPPVATVSRIAAATAAPEAGQDGDSTSLSIVQPDAPSSIAAEGCSNGSAASGADCSCTIAPGVAAGDSRAPRGRTALLEKTLEIENDLPAALLREEHAVRIHLMQEDHKSVLKERQWKKVFEEQNHRLALQKWKIEFEILQLEKAVKQEQLRRMRGGPK